MSDTSIIKEFLVALGFSVDDKKLKGFQKGVDDATKFVGKMATGVEAMAVAVEAAVVKVSSKFEDLYYASQRIGDSVENIRSFGFAMGQMGGSAEGAQRALESVAEWVRSNPAGGAYIRSLGVDLQYVNGQAQITETAMGQLAAVFRSMPYPTSVRIAGMMGIDARTLQAMMRDTGEASARFHELSRRMGVDQDAAAAASKNFMNDLREVLALLVLTGDKIVLAIQPMADKVTRWLEGLNEATGGWSTGLIVLAGVLGPLLLIMDPFVVLIAALAAGVIAIIGYFSDWRGGLSDVGDGLKDIWDAVQPLVEALETLGVVLWKVGGPTLSALLNTTFKLIADGLHLIADFIRVVIDLLTGQWAKAWKDNGKFGLDVLHTMGDALGGLIKMASAFAHGLEDAWNWMSKSGGHKGQQTAPPANDNAAAPGKAITGAAVAVGDHVRAFLAAHGLSSAQAAGVTAGAAAESRLDSKAVNPTSGAFGIGQWLGSRKAELFRRYGRNPSLDQQLEFMLWELRGGDRGGAAVLAQRSATGAMQSYIQQFMRPGKGTAGDLLRGQQYLASNAPLTSGGAGRGQPVTMSQKTDIHVHGDSAHATGRAVASEQARVNGDMIRNLKAASS